MIKMDIDCDYIDFRDDSDPCVGSDSSSDEGGLDIVLNGTPELKRKLTVRCSRKPELSSEDEFEKEMNEELNDTVKAMEAARSGKKTGKKFKSEAGSSTSRDEKKEPESYYDDVYFDSDEEEMVTQGDKRVKKKNPVLSNDDLLYDPDMDDQDQKWVDKQRRQYQPGTAGTEEIQRRLPNSDAVLDCPACMSTLCRDCQRHATFENQYRAMFVTNCSVDKSELLKYPEQQPKISKKKMKKKKKLSSSEGGACGPEAGVTESEGAGGDTNKDMFHPVRCTECNTVVAVYDQDEVYHFFNVLASYT